MRAAIVLVIAVAASTARAQVRREPEERTPPVVVRCVVQQPPSLRAPISLLDIALHTELTMRNNFTPSCAFAAVRNAELIETRMGRVPRIFVVRTVNAAHAVTELDGVILNRGHLSTLKTVLREEGISAFVDIDKTRAEYIAYEAGNPGWTPRDVTRVPRYTRLGREFAAGVGAAGGLVGAFGGGAAGNRVADHYDVDPVYRVALVQAGSYGGSTVGSALASKGLGYVTQTPKMPLGASGGAVGGTVLAGAGTAAGVHAAMWHDVIEPEASNAMSRRAAGDRLPVPAMRYVSDGGANLRRELAEQRAEAEYYACIARWWGLGIYVCSYPKHWRVK